MAVFSLACTLYTVLVGICFPENRQGVTTLFTDLRVQTLPFDWKHHCSHAGDDGTAASHNRRLGSVDATPRACAPSLHLVEQAVHVFTAQASAGGTSTTHSCRFGSVDATPGAVHDCQATEIPCRRGSVDATPGASAPDLRSERSAIAFVAQVRNAGAATTQAGRLEFVNTTPYVCAGSASSSFTGSLGSVDATPGADDDGTVTETTRRLGSVDATPGAYAPDRRSVGPACAPAAQVIAAGTATTQPHLLAGGGLWLPHPGPTRMGATPFAPKLQARYPNRRTLLQAGQSSRGARAQEGMWMPHPALMPLSVPLVRRTSNCRKTGLWSPHLHFLSRPQLHRST